MKQLRNLVERKKLMQQVRNEPFQRKIISFYRYMPIEDPQAFRDELYLTWLPLDILGRIYVAHEGINAQMAIPESKWDAFLETLIKFSILKDIFINEAADQPAYAFFKLDIRSRKKIVVDGLEENVFEKTTPGQHLAPEQFHEMVGQKNTIVVDARNYYECDIGHFENAILPKSKTFSQVLPELEELLEEHRDKNILMYCTGGIRCEKASAFLRSKGFEKVFQLQGGIVNYIKQIKQKFLESKYIGSMYVFDERMAEKSTEEKIGTCQHCKAPHSTHSNCGHIHCHKLMIQCPSCSEKFDGCCSEDCIQKKNFLKQA